MTTRCVHYIGFRGDEFVRARAIFGGPVIIHRVHDPRANRDIDHEHDLVLFANDEREGAVRLRNAPDVIGFGYTPEGKDRTD
jgi:hypothetical protein